MTPDPSQPTNAAPGTEAKLLIMAARFALGLPLFHPLDSAELTPEEVAERVKKARPKQRTGKMRAGRDLPPCIRRYYRDPKRFIAQAGGKYHLGIFDTVEEALAAVRRFYGEDAA